MSFIWPPLLVSLALIPVGLLVLRRIDRTRRVRAATLGGLGGVVAAPSRRSRIRDRIPFGLVLAALAVLGVALARPQAAVSLPRAEGTVILTFDVSASMAATDASPTRMELVKAVARATVEQQPDGVIIGVVAFSDAGLSVQTPTADRAAVTAAIDRLEPALGTSLGEGMIAALDAIAQAEGDTPAEYYSNRVPEPTPLPDVEPGGHESAVIVLLSDGENTARPDPVSIAATAAERGIRVHTVGVGTVAGVTLELDGFSVHTQLDPAMLEEVARITTGEYHPAEGPEAMTWIYDDLARRFILRTEWIEITSLLAGLGVALLVAGAGLSLFARGRLP